MATAEIQDLEFPNGDISDRAKSVGARVSSAQLCCAMTLRLTNCQAGHGVCRCKDDIIMTHLHSYHILTSSISMALIHRQYEGKGKRLFSVSA